MKIVVLVKQVPDSQAVVRVSADHKSIDDSSIVWGINPYDEFAIEAALRIKGTQPSATVLLVSLGPDRVQQVLRTGLAMGADAATHIKVEHPVTYMEVAKVMAYFLKNQAFDLILTGKQAVDDDAAAVGPALAGLLDIPQMCVVRELEYRDGMIRVEKETDGGSEVWECALPVLVTIQLGINQPRFPSLAGIMKSKKVPINVVPIESLQSVAGHPHQVEKLTEPPGRKPGRLLLGSPTDQVNELLTVLKHEAKVL